MSMSEGQRIQAIKNGCPGATSDFVLEAASGSDSIDSIQDRLIRLNQQRIVQQDEELATLTTEHQRLRAEHDRRIGVRPLSRT